MVGSKGVEAGRAFIRLGVSDETDKAFKAIRRKALQLSRNIGRIADTTLKFAGALAAPIALATRSFAKYGDQIDKMSKRTNLTTDAVQSLSFAFEQSGGSADSMEKATRGMNRQLVDLDRGLSTAKDNFRDLNLTAKDFENLDTEQRLKLIISRLGGIKDEGKRAGIAMKIFGRSGNDVLPLIGTIDDLQKEFDRLGVKLDGDTIKNAADVTDEFNRVRLTMMKLFAEVGSAISGDLQEFSSWMRDSIVSASQWVKKNKEWIVTLAKVAAGLLALGAALKTVSLGFGAIAMLSNPYVAVIAGAAAALIAVQKLNKAIGNTYEDLSGPGGMFGVDKKSVIGAGGTGRAMDVDATNRTNERIRKEAQRRIDAGIDVRKNKAVLMRLDGKDPIKEGQKQVAKALESAGEEVKKNILGSFEFVKELKNTVMIDIAEMRQAHIEKSKENRKARQLAKQEAEKIAQAKEFLPQLVAQTMSAVSFGSLGLAAGQHGGAVREIHIQEDILTTLQSIDAKVGAGGVQ